jgi:lipid-A-disaccharide synthase
MFLELKQRKPGIRGVGMGGAKMAEAGIDVRYDSSGISVLGVVEVLKHYPEIRRVLTKMQDLLTSTRPDLLICVDYKEFNFKLARYAKQQGIKVLFYVSPQVWAWRPGRALKYGAVIDMMAVIFPFEIPYYEAHDIPVRYVGHPSVDKIHPQYSIQEDIKRFNLKPNNPIIGILPGSRSHEIIRILPVMLQAAKIIVKEFPQAQFILPQADSITDELLQDYLDQSTVKIRTVKNLPYDVIQCCNAVITFSGTASLEVALLGVPMLIVCKLSAITYWLGRLLVKTPFIGLPNIVAGKAIVKELIQHHATAKNMAAEVINILADQNYANQIKDALVQVKEKLGKGGGSHNMAILAEEMLRKS